ncbi:HAMP domain-containing histidine kinase [Methylobacterium sp. NMS14P]|uniref:sensor histidine kinase n=1 Tax=Methylobacterium sp. NMS14P TaxID=2894310 RepID=UPI002358E40C|nr:HAMP domain-containing sensor histidine kinase [Methylobacterium sp. NMS14P]WCS22980.1 HAMP domain-containing histidine kinase [Methylobacterium sp. NMS14P]
MRVGPKIALVGGVPILAAGAIAMAGWLLLAQEERARRGAVLVADVYHDIATARLVRDQYAAADAQDRSGYAERFAGLTARAEAGLGRLAGFARIDEQRARIASVERALARYRGEMDAFVRRTRENDGLIREMTQRADTLIDLTDRARLRQQASNADLARSMAEKVEALRVARGLVARLNTLRARSAEGAVVAAQTAAQAAAQTAARSDATASGLAGGVSAESDGPRAQSLFRAASRDLATALRADGRDADADSLDALTVEAAGQNPDLRAKLDGWIERTLKIETSGQESLHDEVAQLLAYSVEANEIEQATQNVAIGTLKLGPRTSGALLHRDAALAERMRDEGERLARSAASLPISPLIQAEMVQALDGWRARLTTTIGGLRQQNAMIVAMDGLAATMIDSAKALNDAFVEDADRFGIFIQRILLAGAAGLLLFGALVVIFVARSILVPLRALQGDMVMLTGNPAGAAVRGTARRDELGDIARATAVFVSEITRREGALRRAKDQTDVALVELRRTQDNLVRAEKLASLGQLVAGVAHEINTPLGIALTTGTLMSDEARTFRTGLSAGTLSRSRLNHFVDRVEEGATLLCTNLTRAADLVQGFKQVAVDRVSDESRSVALATWLDDLLTSLRPMLRKGGHVVERACPADLVIDTNPGVLAQIVTNLIANAVVHGFRAGEPGRIIVDVSEREGGLVRMEVRDTGEGIPPEHLDRIFDPFFTTARSAGSTGLGMHIVHNLVTAKLGGRIAVSSERGQGTVVQVDFPAEGAGAAARPRTGAIRAP